MKSSKRLTAGVADNASKRNIHLKTASWLLGRLPAGLGQWRLANAYWQRRQLDYESRLTVKMAGGARHNLDIADRMQALALLTRRYAPELHRFILRNLPDDGVFVDVGANVGLVAIPVARKRRDARVLCIEPEPENMRHLRYNLALNGLGSVMCEQVALDDKTGVGRLAVGGDSGSGYLGCDGKLTVTTVTLDELCKRYRIDKIDVMKIDVEGNEPRVIDGARNLLEAGAVRCVVTEINEAALRRAGFSASALFERMAQYDFVSHRMRRRTVLGGRASGDMAFVLRQ